MKNISISLIAAALLLVLCAANGYCDNERSYTDTVALIQETMAQSTSDARKESYGYIRFSNCSMEYNVLGTYPVGDLYNIKFSTIDFSSLNDQLSKVGHDYTAFITLNFRNDIHSKDDFKEITVHSLVVNVSSDEKAQLLYKAFLHLGALCGSPKMQRD